MPLYTPDAFREHDLARQHQLICDYPLGLLISARGDELRATPLPFALDATRGPLGTLDAHLARANDHWRDLDGTPVLVVFQGPNTYISPGWYPSKAEHGKAVPTWNYVTVQAHGVARIVDDEVWLRRHVERLTDAHEAGREDRWRVDDAPADYVAGMLKAIVGIEIEIRSLDGKWKVSQNRTLSDRQGVVDLSLIHI